MNLPGQLDRYTGNLVPLQNIANWRITVQPSISCRVSLVFASISHIYQVISRYLQVFLNKIPTTAITNLTFHEILKICPCWRAFQSIGPPESHNTPGLSDEIKHNQHHFRVTKAINFKIIEVTWTT